MSFKFNLKKRAKGRFAVRMRSYKLEDRKAAGKEDKEYVEKTLPESEWARYGFGTKMSYEEASAHKKSLNAQNNLRDIEERKARFKLVKRAERSELLQTAYLPKYIVETFEKKLRNDSYAVDFEKSKTYYHWLTAMRVIADLEMNPIEWADNKRTFLKKFEGYAPSTVAKLISLMNSYGTFYGKRINQYYERITMPRGVEVGRISDKYLDKTGGKTKEVKGITLKTMKALKEHNQFYEDEINWCIVCLGFALRPSEMDMVAKRDEKTLIIRKSSVKIYQAKLVSLPKTMRFKEVLVHRPFQKEALAIIKSDKRFRRPTNYKIKKWLGKEYGLYSFRKGYVDIMLSLKENITRISFDMGHSSIDRTWKSYRKRITANSV